MDSYPALDLRYSPGPETSALQEQLYAALYDFEPLAISEHETADGWRVFFTNAAQRDAAIVVLRTIFPTRLTGVSALDVPDDGWARRSQEQLKAIRIDRIIVAPPWDVPVSRDMQTRAAASRDPRPASCVVVIDPSMGFGTGHHETTRLCLRLLQQTDLRGKRVIDVGTGSGVLAIAAAKLGAAAVVAVDYDADALANARENIARNDAAVEVLQCDLESVSLAPADVVVANLTAAVLERYAITLRALTKETGTLIVSGFSPDEAAVVTRQFRGLRAAQLTEGAWAALLLRRDAGLGRTGGAQE